MKFEAILGEIRPVPYLAVAHTCSLEEVSDQVTQMPNVRGIYILDAKQRLEGYLSLGLLLQYIVDIRPKPHFHVRSLLTAITAQTVADIMERRVLFAQPADMLDTVLDKMLMRNIKQIPIVDTDHRIITVVGILDIWKWVQR